MLAKIPIPRGSTNATKSSSATLDCSGQSISRNERFNCLLLAITARADRRIEDCLSSACRPWPHIWFDQIIVDNSSAVAVIGRCEQTFAIRSRRSVQESSNKDGKRHFSDLLRASRAVDKQTQCHPAQIRYSGKQVRIHANHQFHLRVAGNYVVTPATGWTRGNTLQHGPGPIACLPRFGAKMS
jgi:hypothetical protein